MTEKVYVRCEDGSVMPHDLPLPVGIADRVARGDLSLVNADGSPLGEVQAPAPVLVEPERPSRRSRTARASTE
jgi:hypothetical protein